MRPAYKRWSSKAAQVILTPVRDRLTVSAYPTDFANQPRHYYFPFPPATDVPKYIPDGTDATWDAYQIAIRPYQEACQRVWATANQRFDDLTDEYRVDKRYPARIHRLIAAMADTRRQIVYLEDTLANPDRIYVPTEMGSIFRTDYTPANYLADQLANYHSRLACRNADLTRQQAELAAMKAELRSK